MRTLRIIQLLMVFLLCGGQCALHGMEDELKKSFLSIDHSIVRDVIIATCLTNQDYHTYRTVAMLSRAYNTMIEDKYRPKKKCIEEYIQENKDVLPQLTGTRSWNKDFSKCAWVTYDGDVATSKNLGLTCIGKSGNQVIQQSASWEGFYFPIFEDNIRPFFDEAGRACFHGYKNTKVTNGGYRYLAQYVLDVPAFFYECYYGVKDNNEYPKWSRHLMPLFQHPLLIKAFLQSQEQEVYCTKNGTILYKIFYINGVTIPKNYKFFKKSLGLEQMELDTRRYYSGRTSYDSLESELRQAIDERYQEQQDEKKGNIV